MKKPKVLCISFLGWIWLSDHPKDHSISHPMSGFPARKQQFQLGCPKKANLRSCTTSTSANTAKQSTKSANATAKWPNSIKYISVVTAVIPALDPQQPNRLQAHLDAPQNDHPQLAPETRAASVARRLPQPSHGRSPHKRVL
jgi:hypothetical protein